MANQGSNSASSASSVVLISEKRGHLLATLDGREVLYRDVPVNEWYAPYVSLLIENQVAEGYKDEGGKLTGEFGVVDPVTYAELLKMALEASGKDLSTPLPPPRNPSAKASWASNYVSNAEQMKMSVYLPSLDINTPATRGAVIQTVLEAMGFTVGKTLSTFSDVPKDHPYSRSIALAAFNGFISGDTAPDGTPLNRFRPDDLINRAEVSKIISLVREVQKLN